MDYIRAAIQDALMPHLIDVPLNAAKDHHEVAEIEVLFRLRKSVQFTQQDLTLHFVLDSIAAAMKAIAEASGEVWDFYHPEMIMQPVDNSPLTPRVVIKARFYCRPKPDPEIKGKTDVHTG